MYAKHSTSHHVVKQQPPASQVLAPNFSWVLSPRVNRVRLFYVLAQKYNTIYNGLCPCIANSFLVGSHLVARFHRDSVQQRKGSPPFWAAACGYKSCSQSLGSAFLGVTQVKNSLERIMSVPWESSLTMIVTTVYELTHQLCLNQGLTSARLLLQPISPSKNYQYMFDHSKINFSDILREGRLRVCQQAWMSGIFSCYSSYFSWYWTAAHTLHCCVVSTVQPPSHLRSGWTLATRLGLLVAIQLSTVCLPFFLQNVCRDGGSLELWELHF